MSPLMIKLRSIARKTGVTNVINWCMGFFENYYEEKFGSCMLSHIRKGDVVWDVGANLGLYSKQFLEVLGKDGALVCFEPAPACFQALEKDFSGIENVYLENTALGEENAEGTILLESDGLAATHQVFSLDKADNQGKGHVEHISIMSGDSYCKVNGRTPDIIKIDVEGFELEVIKGISNLLKSPNLRGVFCEIHFALLEQRGKQMAPKRIEEMFQANGYQVSWIDASHLMAIKSIVE